MEALLNEMIENYNVYSQLVAFNAAYGADDGTIQWNKGNLKSTEDYMEKLADILGVKLIYDFSYHGCSFEYLTVKVVK